jgi:hypothetical protein
MYWMKDDVRKKSRRIKTSWEVLRLEKRFVGVEKWILHLRYLSSALSHPLSHLGYSIRSFSLYEKLEVKKVE